MPTHRGRAGAPHSAVADFATSDRQLGNGHGEVAGSYLAHLPEREPLAQSIRLLTLPRDQISGCGSVLGTQAEQNVRPPP
jgi:hypothetical protein